MNQIKNKYRVNKFGEVFTAEREVKAMCDLIPSSEWTIESKFLEPSCGNGNFLIEIADRKFKLCNDSRDGLKALNSIIGIDIMADNIKESKVRLLHLFLNYFPDSNDIIKLLAIRILNNNIICGDSLKIQKQWE